MRELTHRGVRANQLSSIVLRALNRGSSNQNMDWKQGGKRQVSKSLDEVSGSEGSSEKVPEFSHKGKPGEEVSST